MKIDRADALRYMGQKDIKNISGGLSELLDECEDELRRAARPLFAWRVFDIETDEGGALRLAGCGVSLEGNAIKKHLRCCEKAAVICATLSADVDRWLKRQALADSLRGLACDALASAMTESAAEEARADMLAKNEGFYATWIFGAGYGDFPIEIVPRLLAALDAERKLGVTCLASNMLVPTKSIIGAAGLSRVPIEERGKKCGSCNMREKCEFRQE